MEATIELFDQVSLLEKQRRSKSRLCRLIHLIEPLVEFLMLYSPAVDMIVQYDVSPSAMVWGSLKAAVYNCMSYYAFVERTLTDVAQILSTKTRYQNLFEKEPAVQSALKELYTELAFLLQDIQSMVSKKSVLVVLQNLLRPVDARFRPSVQRLGRLNEAFREEVELAHCKTADDQLREQRRCNTKFDELLVQLTHDHDQRHDHELRREIVGWLGHYKSHEAYYRAARKRLSGTCLWIFEEPCFQDWTRSSAQHAKSRLLWIRGAPGAGKTVLSTAVVDSMNDRDSGIYACDTLVTSYYGDSTKGFGGTAFNVCSSIISQITSKLPRIPKILLETYRMARCHGRPRISEEDNVYQLFQGMLGALTNVCIIIDALDEYEEVKEIAEWLETSMRSAPQLRVAYFSRDTASVRNVLDKAPYINVDERAIRADVERYIATGIETLSYANTNLKQYVLGTLSHKASGVFLYADLSVQTLRSACHEEDLLRLLHATPHGLYDIYDLIMSRVDEETPVRKKLAHRALILLCTAIRPMTWSEMRFALSWDPMTRQFHSKKEPFKETVFELCCPLIEHVAEGDTFQLVHFSVHEYLRRLPTEIGSNSRRKEPLVAESDAHAWLASMTLSYLAEQKLDCMMDTNAPVHGFSAYAALHWSKHLLRSEFSEDLYATYSMFMDNTQARCRWILQWLIVQEWSYPLQEMTRLLQLVQDWVAQEISSRRSLVPILKDIQTTLIALDENQIMNEKPSSESHPKRTISNFERLICLRDLAREYTRADGLEDGIGVFERAIADMESSINGLGSRSGWLLNSLGILYDQQGKTQKAMETQYKALSIQEKTSSPTNLDLVITINELGRVSRHLDRFEDAESFHRKALETLQQTLPEDDLHITWTKSALGRALLKQDRPSEAIQLHEQVWHVEIKRLGRDHPHTLWTLSDIARCYSAQGNTAKAITAQEEVLESSKERLGPQNTDTLWAMNSLGLLYETCGDKDTARSLHSAALEGQKRTLGTSHTHTRWSQEALCRLDGRPPNNSA